MDQRNCEPGVPDVCSGGPGGRHLDRGNGLIYDDHLDVTWLENANLAATNQFGVTQSALTGPAPGEIGSNGLMSWDTANNWIAGMNAATYKGINNWRLPTTLDSDSTCSGGPGRGTGCTGSEMGHLYNVEGITFTVPGPLFDNVQANAYWSGTEFAPLPGNAWNFNFDNGDQNFNSKVNPFVGWAVRSGDVSAPPIPEPSTILLLGSGLVGLIGWQRARRGSMIR